MRIECLELDTTPANEPCQQVGPNYRPEFARIEANAFVCQILHQFPNTDRIKIRVVANYGNYTTYSVAIYYNPQCEESCQQAFDIEANVLTEWQAGYRQMVRDQIVEFDDMTDED